MPRGHLRGLKKALLHHRLEVFDVGVLSEGVDGHGVQLDGTALYRRREGLLEDPPVHAGQGRAAFSRALVRVWVQRDDDSDPDGGAAGARPGIGDDRDQGAAVLGEDALLLPPARTDILAGPAVDLAVPGQDDSGGEPSSACRSAGDALAFLSYLLAVFVLVLVQEVNVAGVVIKEDLDVQASVPELEGVPRVLEAVAERQDLLLECPILAQEGQAGGGALVD
mmetsp:Transcript_14012/g.24990  ORF Transcript_14012/g.24990 Transcript_14012/m.24990 type:complete len:223 (+) Transcript_14012:1535-2203(+)